MAFVYWGLTWDKNMDHLDHAAGAVWIPARSPDALDKLGLKGAVTGQSSPILFGQTHRVGRVLTRQAGSRGRAFEHPASLYNPRLKPLLPATSSWWNNSIRVWMRRPGVGNLSIGAQVRGVAGVIVDGPVRDIDDSRKLDFPVFARDHTAKTARGRIVEVATGEPIDVGGVAVSPGVTTPSRTAARRYLWRKARYRTGAGSSG